MKRVTDYIIDTIASEGVRHVFLVPGGTIDPFLEALSDSQSVTPIVAAHEEGAVYMADGYARLSKRFGAAIVISGPGITNTITPLTTASTDRSPVFVISGEVKTEWEGRGAFQDSSSAGVRSLDIARPVTSLQMNLSSASQAESHLGRLFRHMLNHTTRGPVHLSIPVDIQKSQTSAVHHALPAVLYEPRFVDTGACDAFWDKVGDATKVAILAGTGAAMSGATEALVQFAETFHIPVATTMPAKGVFPEQHPLSLGTLGWFGTRWAIEALLSGEVEILFVLGSRLNMLDTLIWSKELQPRKALILNDINTNSIFREYNVDLAVLADARECLKYLSGRASDCGGRLTKTIGARKQWLESIKSAGTMHYHTENCSSDVVPIHPARAIADLRAVMPDNTVVFGDSGAHGFFAGHYWTTYAPDQFFSCVKYMGSMGWAIAAGIGAKLARPDLPCLVITGDGCMLMRGMEVQTAARYNIPVIFVVINNSALGNPKLRADRISDAMARMHELPTHDWAAFARSLGADGFTVERPEQMVPTYKKALALGRPVVIDVRTGNYPTPTDSFDLRIGGGH